jgi:NAD(P)-dependent dehydrogenase (short-subunit alcohol dehydrogenase family)
MEHLAGKVAVITGAGRGIGQRTAVRLAQMKVKTALVSRTETQLRETADLVLQAGGTPLIVAVDLSNPMSIETIKARVIDELGQPSILINAAGMFGPIELVWKTDPNEWIKTQMVNVVGAYLICYAFMEGHGG